LHVVNADHADIRIVLFYKLYRFNKLISGEIGVVYFKSSRVDKIAEKRFFFCVEVTKRFMEVEFSFLRFSVVLL
jgi:hypothetical protein